MKQPQGECFFQITRSERVKKEYPCRRGGIKNSVLFDLLQCGILYSYV